MKIVKNKDFKKDLSKKRKQDSPLRYPMHAEWAETHEERIAWLYYENSCIAEEYVSAKLLYALGKIRLQEKDNEQFISLERYRAVKEAFNLWEEANEAKAIENLVNTADGVKALERMIQMQKVNIGVNRDATPATKTRKDLEQMMLDPRYSNPNLRDEAYVKEIDNAFAKMFG